MDKTQTAASELCEICGKVKRSEMQQRHYQADTMSDIISFGSPSGRVSKRSRKAADALIAERLYGVRSGCTGHRMPTQQERATERVVYLRRRIQTLETCCAGRLATGRQNETTREIAKLRRELDAI